MSKKSNRRVRMLQLENAAAQTKFRIRASQLNLNIIEQVGVCARTIDDALELLEEASELLPHDEFCVSDSSSLRTGVHLLVARKSATLN